MKKIVSLIVLLTVMMVTVVSAQITTMSLVCTSGTVVMQRTPFDHERGEVLALTITANSAGKVYANMPSLYGTLRQFEFGLGIGADAPTTTATMKLTSHIGTALLKSSSGVTINPVSGATICWTEVLSALGTSMPVMVNGKSYLLVTGLTSGKVVYLYITIVN